MSLTTEQAATTLGVPPATIRQWVHRQHLQPKRRGTRPLEFDEDTVAAFQDRRWRDEQHRIGSRLGPECAEYDRLLAAQVRAVSRSAAAQPSPNQD